MGANSDVVVGRRRKQTEDVHVSFSESYLPKVLLASGAAGRPVRYGLQWWAQISRASASVLVGNGLSASAIKLQDACVLGILNGAEIV